jgi:hypothetical protein
MPEIQLGDKQLTMLSIAPTPYVRSDCKKAQYPSYLIFRVDEEEGTIIFPVTL